MPGRHPQQRHDPTKGAGGGDWIETKDWKGRNVEYRAAYGPFDTRNEAALYSIHEMSFEENMDLLAIEDVNTGKYYLGRISTKRDAGSKFDDNWEERKVGKTTINVYHATSQEAVDSIREQGIRAHTAGGVNAVYFTTSEESAAVYGESHGDKFAIVEFGIPDKLRGSIEVDKYDASLYGATEAFYIPQDVPPNWIKAVHMYEAPMEFSMPRKVRTVKEQSYYAVVVIDDNFD